MDLYTKEDKKKVNFILGFFVHQPAMYANEVILVQRNGDELHQRSCC
jgi:hypothetical protein